MKQSKIVFLSSRLFTETRLGETRMAEPTKNCWSMLYVFGSLGYLNEIDWILWIVIWKKINTRRKVVEQQF